jgi:hypothetical protein
MKRIIYILISGLVLLVSGCNREDAWDMVKTRGDRATLQKDLSDFRAITAGNGINIVLRHGNRNVADLDGWENLMGKIRLSIDANGMLTIEDTNQFNFVRNDDNKTTVYLSFSGDVTNITFSGSGTITSDDTLHVSSLSISCIDASGDIDLTVNTSTVSVFTALKNAASVTLRGSCTGAGVDCGGYGPVDLSRLNTHTVGISAWGTANVYVNASESLHASVFALGDIYYKGNPSITFTSTGKGKLYKMPDD